MQKENPKHKRRAMTSEAASRVKLAGHEAEKEFAELIGGHIYPGSRKKDVVDIQGNMHSVKSGEKKWQIFLYCKNRFEESVGFLGAKLFIACINCFPDKREEYLADKTKYKSNLKKEMRELASFLTQTSPLFIHSNKLIFLNEALFHSSEVDYLTIKEGPLFHVFDALQVIKTIDESINVENSKANQEGQMDDQKVIFKLSDKGITMGEIEMRNDSAVHFRQVKFWADREIVLSLLKEKIKPARKKSDQIIAYGKAAIRFKMREGEKK